MEIAVWVAVLALAGTFIGFIIKTASKYGNIDTRITSLEKELQELCDKNSDQHKDFYESRRSFDKFGATIETTLKFIVEKLANVDTSMNDRLNKIELSIDNLKNC